MATDSPETTETTQEHVAVWLRNPRTGMVNLVIHPETIRRCLSEGHTAVPDPRLPVPASAENADVAPSPHAEAFSVSPVQPPAKPEKSERATRRKGA